MSEDVKGERLQKVLARAGIASRRKSELLITQGLVCVNGEIVIEQGRRVGPTDEVSYRGRVIHAQPLRYYLLHKPRSEITSLDDPQGRPCVGDRLQELDTRVHPVGRLDYDAEGLLLITNDGDLTQSVLHPSAEVPRIYHAKVRGEVREEKLEMLRQGVELEDGPGKALRCRISGRASENTWVELVVGEGRWHFVKRLLEKVELPVQRLRRVGFGGLRLAGLELGELREIDHELALRATDSSMPDPVEAVLINRQHNAPGSVGGFGGSGSPLALLAMLASLTVSAMVGCGDSQSKASETLQQSSSPILREAAATRLAELGGDEAMRLLTTKGLRDESPRVRVASLKGLSGMSQPRLIGLFADKLQDPAPSVAAAAAAALATQGGTRAKRTLQRAYGRASWHTRLAIAHALDRMNVSPSETLEGWSKTQLAAGLKAARSRSNAERIGAAERIGQSGRPEAVAVLLSLLADRNAAVVAAAARGLGAAGERRAMRPLMALLKVGAGSVRADAARALEQLGDPAALPGLLDAVQGADEAGTLVLLDAIEALESKRISKPAAVVAPVHYLCSAALLVPTRRAAFRAGQLLRRSHLPCTQNQALEEQLGARDVNLLVTLELLGALSKDDRLSKRGLSRLEALAKGRNPLVSDAAVAALVRLSTEAGPRTEPDAGPDTSLEALRSHFDSLRKNQKQGREDWVKHPLPARSDWIERLIDPSNAEAIIADEDTMALVGLQTGRAYQKRFNELLGKVAGLEAERKAEAAIHAGQGDFDLAKATKKSLDALRSEPSSDRLELIRDEQPAEHARLLLLTQTLTTLYERNKGATSEGASASRLGADTATQTQEDVQRFASLLEGQREELQLAAARGLVAMGAEAGELLRSKLGSISSLSVLQRVAPQIVNEMDLAKIPLRERLEGVQELPELLRGPLLSTLGVGLRGSRVQVAQADEKEVSDFLLAALQSPATTEYAAQALQLWHTDRARQALVDRASSGARPGRLGVYRALAGFESGLQRDEQLLDGLHDPDSEIRRIAATALAAEGVPEGGWLSALELDFSRLVRAALAPKGNRARKSTLDPQILPSTHRSQAVQKSLRKETAP